MKLSPTHLRIIGSTQKSGLRTNERAVPCGGDAAQRPLHPASHCALLCSEAELPCVIRRRAKSSYHLTEGNLCRKAERVFRGTPFSSPDLRKALLVTEGREITLVKDNTWDSKSSACKRYQHVDKMDFNTFN